MNTIYNDILIHLQDYSCPVTMVTVLPAQEGAAADIRRELALVRPEKNAEGKRMASVRFLAKDGGFLIEEPCLPANWNTKRYGTDSGLTLPAVACLASGSGPMAAATVLCASAGCTLRAGEKWAVLPDASPAPDGVSSDEIHTAVSKEAAALIGTGRFRILTVGSDDAEGTVLIEDLPR